MDNAWLKWLKENLQLQNLQYWVITGLVIYNGALIQKQISDLRNDLSVLSALIKKFQEVDKDKQ